MDVPEEVQNAVKTEASVKPATRSDTQSTARFTQNTVEVSLFKHSEIGVVDLAPKASKPIQVRSPDDFLDQPRVHPKSKLRTFEHVLPLKLSTASSVSLPLGLTVVSGATGVGKSSFLRDLNVTRILAVEPADSEEELETLLSFNSADAAILTAILVGHQTGKLIAIDSLREPLFEINGPAAKRGIIMPFFTAVTRVSMSLARNGISLMATVNPMDEEPEFVTSFLSKLSASVSGFINLKSYNPNMGLYEGTIATRDARAPQTFQYSAAMNEHKSSQEVAFNFSAVSQPQSALTGIQLRQLKESF